MKAGIMAPLYLSTSWVLTVSYQLFTENAVNAIATSVGSVWSGAGTWITLNENTIVFVYAFTWIFVLSSVLPSVILGKERGILIQYIVVLTLTLIAFFMEDIILAISGFNIATWLSTNNLLGNPALAAIYLAIPYLVMVGIDYRSKKQTKRDAAQKAANEEWNKRKTAISQEPTSESVDAVN